MLQEAGAILHQAKSGRLIVKVSREVGVGSVLVDERGRKVGKVIELIGPVSSPYASVAPVTSRFGKGDRVFVQG